MDKDTRELLRRTLAMTDDKQLLKFAKSYAAKDQAFAKAIIEKFLPTEEAVDYEKMVEDCFEHRKKGRARVYGSSLDWTAIRRDIKRVLKQLEYVRQRDGKTAANGALLLLSRLAEEFDLDHVYEDDNYDRSNYGNEQALDIVHDVLIHDESVSRDDKAEMVEWLREIEEEETYKHYLSCDIRGVIDSANRQLLSPNDLLKELDRNIAAAKYSTDKARYVERKITLLREQNRDDEAERVITQHLDLQEISALRYEQLIREGRYDEARAFCKERIASSSGGWHDAQPWHERLIDIARKTGDKGILRAPASWLFAHGNIRQEDKKEYFRLCRESFADGDAAWPKFRDQMFHDAKAGNSVSIDTVFELYEEEQLFDRMFLYLKKLSDSMPYYSYGSCQNSGGERMHYFSRYASRLTEAQRKEMVASLSATIRNDSRRASTRDSYAKVASGLRLLSESCAEGREAARTIAAQILRENPGKPAYREETRQYDYS